MIYDSIIEQFIAKVLLLIEPKLITWFKELITNNYKLPTSNIGVSSNAPDFLDCNQSVEIAVPDTFIT